MKIQKSTLAASVLAALSLGAAQQAAASVYARSYLDISNLSILISDDGTNPGGATVNTFNFSLNNSATLNGVTAAGSGATVSCANATCGTVLASPTLDKPNTSVIGTPAPGALRGENSFAPFYGPGAAEYAVSDSVILLAALSNNSIANGGTGTTHTTQIAEAELQTGLSAASSAEITSTTGFTFSFTVTGANLLRINFDSVLSLLAQINDPDPLATAWSSQANTNVTFTLQNNTDGHSVSWLPNSATGATACSTVPGATSLACIVNASNSDLQSDAGTTSNNNVPAGLSRNASGAHELQVNNLYNGDWTLTLNSTSSTLLTRSVRSVPEPDTIALLGLGLLGMGFAGRRRTQLRMG